mgnify:CR=1 FL=1
MSESAEAERQFEAWWKEAYEGSTLHHKETARTFWLAAFAAGRREGQAEGLEEGAELSTSYDPQGTLFTQATVRDGIARLLTKHAQQRREGRG